MDNKKLLKELQNATEYIKSQYQPILSRDRKIGDSFQQFDAAVQERAKEVAADSPPPKAK